MKLTTVIKHTWEVWSGCRLESTSQVECETGFSILEVILAVALFVIMGSGAVTVVLQGYNSNRLGAEYTVASQFASEGIEAVKSIKNQAFGNLNNTGGTGVDRVGNVWTFGGVNDILAHNSSDNYTRVIKVDPVNRDAAPPAGNIVSTGGTLDPDTKKITSEVTWNFNAARPETLSLVTYLSDWEKPITGDLIMMAYSKSTNIPYYRTWDGSSWSAEAPAQTVGGNINHIVLKISRTRNEAILGTMDSNGNIYAQVWNGTIWGPPTLMATVGTTLAAYRGFDIDYEKSSDKAVIVYLPNSTSVDPAYRVWDGISGNWSSATTITTPPTTGVIRWIELAANPGSASNEIAMIMLDASGTTGAVYGMAWNGTAWGDMGVASVWDASPSTRDRKAIDVAYEQTSGRAIFIWGDSVPTDQYYRIWNGSGLTGAALLDIPASGGVANWIRLVSRPNSNELLYGVQDAGADLNTRKWSATTAWDTATQHPRHETSVEGVSSMTFDIVWETHSANPGEAWLLWGDGSSCSTNCVAKKQWSGSAWGPATTLTGSDDTTFIRLVSDPTSGAIFAGLYENVTSATRDIWESRLTGGGTTWSAKNTIWAGPIPTEQGLFKIDIATP